MLDLETDDALRARILACPDHMPPEDLRNVQTAIGGYLDSLGLKFGVVRHGSDDERRVRNFVQSYLARLARAGLATDVGSMNYLLGEAVAIGTLRMMK